MLTKILINNDSKDSGYVVVNTYNLLNKQDAKDIMEKVLSKNIKLSFLMESVMMPDILLKHENNWIYYNYSNFYGINKKKIYCYPNSDSNNKLLCDDDLEYNYNNIIESKKLNCILKFDYVSKNWLYNDSCVSIITGYNIKKFDLSIVPDELKNIITKDCGNYYYEDYEYSEYFGNMLIST